MRIPLSIEAAALAVRISPAPSVTTTGAGRIETRRSRAQLSDRRAACSISTCSCWTRTSSSATRSSSCAFSRSATRAARPGCDP